MCVCVGGGGGGLLREWGLLLPFYEFSSNLKTILKDMIIISFSTFLDDFLLTP